jgi:hypothetical protein
MHIQIIVFCIVGILLKTWTNALFVPQVVTKIIPVIVVAKFKVQVMRIKGSGRVQSVACVEPADTILGISEKQSRIPVMVMQYLPVADRLSVGYFSDVRINPQAHGYCCSFHLGVSQGY